MASFGRARARRTNSVARPFAALLAVSLLLLLFRSADVVRATATVGTQVLVPVQRVLAERRPFAVNHVDSEPWLAGRASVVGLGLQSLVCVPMLDGEQCLGAVYADRCEAGEPLTQLDLELLGAFAESAAVYVLAGRAMAALDDAPRWNSIVSHAREEPRA